VEEVIPQFADGFVDLAVLPHLVGLKNHLTANDFVTGGSVKDVEPVQETVVRTKNVERNDDDIPEALADRVDVDLETALVEHPQEHLPLQLAKPFDRWDRGRVLPTHRSRHGNHDRDRR
jgi:hypothetical protein